MKERIIKISNILVMMENQISNIGLTKGKMGIALFLYYSSKVTGYKFYQDLADKCIDEVLEKIKSETNLSFPNGMAGIAFTINHLIKDKFIDADADDILINVDKKIYSEYKKRSLNDFAEDFSLFTYGLYLLERTNYEDPKSQMGVSIEQATDLALNICEEVYNSNFYFDSRTIIYTNSVLHFLIKLNSHKQYVQRSNSLIELIIAKMMIALNSDSALWNNMDVIQNLGLLIPKTNPITQTFLSTISGFSEKKKEVNEFDAEKAWQEILFHKSYKYNLSLEMVDDLINDVYLFYDNHKLINESCRALIASGLHILRRFNTGKD